MQCWMCRIRSSIGEVSLLTTVAASPLRSGKSLRSGATPRRLYTLPQAVTNVSHTVNAGPYPDRSPRPAAGYTYRAIWREYDPPKPAWRAVATPAPASLLEP